MEERGVTVYWGESFCLIKKVLEMDSGDGFTTV